jgi:glycerophosphoryl diester phosphodiesterase
MKVVNHKSTLILFLAIAAQLFVGCSKSDDNTPNNTTQIEASFTINDSDNLLVGQIITFTNTSTFEGSDISYTWNFGDESQTSSQENPTHVYDELGDYVVTLTASLDSVEDSFSEELLISLTSDISGRKTILEELEFLDDKIMVCAHRGQHENAPENSIESIQNAIDQGIRMVELDVRQTKDGILVLMHDNTIDRTTNGTGSLEDMTFQELQQFNLFKEDGTLTTQRIPSLEEVLTLSRSNIYLDLDIHNKAPHNKVYQMVKKYGMLNQVIIYTKDVTAINNLNQKIAVMPMIEDQSSIDYFSNLNISVTHFNSSTFNQNYVTQAVQQGWYTFSNAYINTTNGPDSDNNSKINLIINLEGDIVQTDYPTLIKNYLATQNLN